MKIQILFLIIFLFVMFSLVEKKETDEIEQITSIIQDVSEDDERSRSIQIVQEKFSWKNIFFQIAAIVLLVFCLLLVFFSLTKFYEPIFINPYSNEMLEELFNKLGLTIINNDYISNDIIHDDFYIDPKTDPDNFFRALEEVLDPEERRTLQNQINNNPNGILNEQNKNIVIESLIRDKIVRRPIRIFYQKRLFGKRYKEPVYSNMYEDKGFEVFLPDDMFRNDQNSFHEYIDNKNLVNELIKICPESLLLKNSKDFYNQKSNDKTRLESLPETRRENQTVEDFFGTNIDIYNNWLKTIIRKNEIKNAENLIQYEFKTPDDRNLLLWAEVDDKNRILNFQSGELDGEILHDYHTFDQNLLFEFDVNKRRITKKKNVIYINYYIEVSEEDFINLYYDNDIYTHIYARL